MADDDQDAGDVEEPQDAPCVDDEPAEDPDAEDADDGDHPTQ